MPTLLLTDSNRGIGLELCAQYLEAGWDVHASCRDPSNATRLNALAEQFPEKLYIHTLDTRNIDQIADLKKTLADTPIDLLFNNAGIYGTKANHLGHLDHEAWLETFRTNVISPMMVIEAFVDNVARSQKKSIVNLTSKMGSIDDNGFGGRYAYRSSKAALNMTMVSASIELKDSDIGVYLIHPGWVRTDMGGPNGELSVDKSVSRIRALVENFTLEDSGKFFDIDGSIIRW